MTANRRGWPWHSAPPDCDDYDAAVWFAIRKHTEGELPRQDVETWVARQRASRDVWEWQPPALLTDAEHDLLRAEVSDALRQPMPTPLLRRYTGRLPR